MSPTLSDDLDTPVPVRADPARIVSLVPSLSETLWWFRVADRVVGVTDHCVAPPHAFPDAVRVRGTKNVDVQAVIDLAPDVVLANREENRQIDIERLREAGIAVYVTAPTTVDGVADSLVGVGEVVGAAGAGAGLAQSIRRAVAMLPDPAPLRTVCPVWRDPWMVTGRGTYAGDLLAHCGLAVVTGTDDDRYPETSLDELRELDPDVVLLPDEPYAFGDEDRAVFARWPARVRTVDGTALTWWGPRTPHALAEYTRLARSIRRRMARSA